MPTTVKFIALSICRRCLLLLSVHYHWTNQLINNISVCKRLTLRYMFALNDTNTNIISLSVCIKIKTKVKCLLTHAENRNKKQQMNVLIEFEIGMKPYGDSITNSRPNFILFYMIINVVRFKFTSDKYDWTRDDRRRDRKRLNWKMSQRADASNEYIIYKSNLHMWLSQCLTCANHICVLWATVGLLSWFIHSPLDYLNWKQCNFRTVFDARIRFDWTFFETAAIRQRNRDFYPPIRHCVVAHIFRGNIAKWPLLTNHIIPLNVYHYCFPVSSRNHVHSHNVWNCPSKCNQMANVLFLLSRREYGARKCNCSIVQSEEAATKQSNPNDRSNRTRRVCVFFQLISRTFPLFVQRIVEAFYRRHTRLEVFRNNFSWSNLVVTCRCDINHCTVSFH